MFNQTILGLSPDHDAGGFTHWHWKHVLAEIRQEKKPAAQALVQRLEGARSEARLALRTAEESSL